MHENPPGPIIGGTAIDEGGVRPAKEFLGVVGVAGEKEWGRGSIARPFLGGRLKKRGVLGGEGGKGGGQARRMNRGRGTC